MDPASVFGIVTGAVQTVQIVGSTLQGLNALKGKFSDADSTIHALTVQLVTIKHALNQLHDWAQYRTEASDHPDYVDGLDIALDGCRMSMELLLEEVTKLTDNASPGEEAFHLGKRARMRVVWNEPLMKDHEQRLHSQVLALNFLLQVCQCRTATEQLELLRKDRNKKLIKKVADDAATLRTAARSSHHVPSITSHGQSSIGDTVFDFDDNVVSSETYRRVLAQHRSASQRLSSRNSPALTSRQNSSASSPSMTDEGYGSEIVRSPSSNTKPSTWLEFPGGDDPPSETAVLQTLQPDDKLNRSQTSALKPSTSLQDDSVRRSQSMGSTLPSSSTSSKKAKVRQALKRLNTTSISSLRARKPPTQLAHSASVAERVQQQRNKYNQSNISIDLSLAGNATIPPIIRAAQAGALVQLEIQLGKGADINTCDETYGRSALAVAAHCGIADAVAYLIEHGAIVDIKDAELSTPFHLAASRGHNSVLEILMAKSDNIYEKDAHGRTALWIAAQGGHLETVRMLIASGFKVRTAAKYQMTALHAASMDGDINMAKLLIECGADIEAKDARMKAPIHHACERGHVEFISMLLDCKGNIEAAGEQRRTPLIYAAMAGQPKVVDYLLKKKASSRSTDEHGMNCVHWAALNGHVEVVELLAKKKMPLKSVSKRGDTALHLAARSGQFAVADYLIRQGAPLEARCEEGFTPLHRACHSKDPELARLILGSGADIEAKAGTYGYRPIHIAILQNNLSLLELLCQESANLDSIDSAGERPLSIACSHGYAPLVKRLLEEGAAPRLRLDGSPFEDSPLCLAAKGGHIDVVSIFLDRGEPVGQHDELGYDPLLYAAHYGHLDVLKLLLLHSSVLQKSKLHESFLQIGFFPLSTIPKEAKDMIKELILQLGPSQPSTLPLIAPESDYNAATRAADRGSRDESVSGAGVVRVDPIRPPVQSPVPPFHATPISELPDNSHGRARRAQLTVGETGAGTPHTRTASVGSQTNMSIPQTRTIQRTESSVSSEISSISPPRLSFPGHPPLPRESTITSRQPSQNSQVETLSALPNQQPNLLRPLNMPATLQGQHSRIHHLHNADSDRALAFSNPPETLHPNISVAEQSPTHQSPEVSTPNKVEARIELQEEQDDESDNESICSFFTAPEEFDDAHEFRDWDNQDDTSDGESIISEMDTRPEVFDYMREFREIPSLQAQLVELEG